MRIIAAAAKKLKKSKWKCLLIKFQMRFLAYSIANRRRMGGQWGEEFVRKITKNKMS